MGTLIQLCAGECMCNRTPLWAKTDILRASCHLSPYAKLYYIINSHIPQETFLEANSTVPRKPEIIQYCRNKPVQDHSKIWRVSQKKFINHSVHFILKVSKWPIISPVVHIKIMWVFKLKTSLKTLKTAFCFTLFETYPHFVPTSKNCSTQYKDSLEDFS